MCPRSSYAPGLTFTVSATGGASGNPIIFDTQTPATCSVGGAGGNVVSVLAGGYCAVSAAQAGNTNYAAATTPVNYIYINQVEQVITLVPVATPLTYAPGLSFTLSASGGASGNPLVYGTSTATICTTTGNVVSVLRAGVCTATVAQAGNAQYNPATTVGADVLVNQASQTVSFAALPNKALSDPPFTVSASATSGIAITFTSITATQCTVSGNTVTLVATGSCTIRAAQSGNVSYLAATNVDQSFTITTGSTTPQAITGFSPATPIAYVPPPAPNNTFTLNATGGGSGNPVTFASTTAGVCTSGGSNGATVTIQTAGTCTLTANQAGNGAYTAAPTVTANVIINQASQSVAFAVLADKALSDPAFTVSATASSGLVVSFTSATTAVCTVATNTVTLVSAGACTVNADQAGDGNYLAATTVSRSFQVTDVAKVYYVHADHLGTPRAITRPSDNQLVWRWDATDPFGANLPNENPSGLGVMKYNNRFPGQYYDEETGAHYNYFRDYDPSLGRYVQSDPIGLLGGISTFAYATSSPLRRFDPRGLWSGADAKLVGYFLSGNGGYLDISEFCDDYLSDVQIQVRTQILKKQVDNETKSRAGSKGKSSFTIRNKNAQYITSIYSFGAGNTHTQTAICDFDGDGCCATATCKLNYYAVDQFDNPLDLCERFGICGEARNVGGRSFWFGLQCSRNYTSKACK